METGDHGLAANHSGQPGAFGLLSFRAGSAENRFAKAAKDDDAEVPVYIWNEFLARGLSPTALSPAQLVGLDAYRAFLLVRWRRLLCLSFLRYLRAEHGSRWWENESEDARRDREVGRECLWRASEATWWNWDAGSTLFFWRWPKPYRVMARDGDRVKRITALPRNKSTQKNEPDAERKSKMVKKLVKIRHRNYIAVGLVLCTTYFFSVQKGEDDIHMVYDATACGLNECVWAPNFGLPTVQSVLFGLTLTSYMADQDLGEMFLNFPLDLSMQAFARVDLTDYLRGEENEPLPYHRWTRCLMGFRPSPYLAVRASIWAEDVARGDPNDLENPLRFDGVVCNSPGVATYDPSMPWVYKFVVVNGERKVAGDVTSFIDDYRPTGYSDEHCWRVSCRVAQLLQYLGIQDERRPPSQTPGAWAGAVIRILEEGIGVAVSDEK